jgi:hypothetical protein
MISFDTVREIAGGLPGAVEGTSYGTPAFHVGKTLFVRQHQDGESLVARLVMLVGVSISGGPRIPAIKCRTATRP